jgi:protein involved in polysaccharide export with SLBB domain
MFPASLAWTLVSLVAVPDRIARRPSPPVLLTLPPCRHSGAVSRQPRPASRRASHLARRASAAALLAAVLFAAVMLPAASRAQTSPTTPPPAVTSPGSTGLGAVASRSDLEALAAGNGPQAASARERLANGDFQAGDRIAMVVQGEPTLSDTVTVRANQVIHLTNMPDISLHGVLRSELQDFIKQQLGQYLRNPDVRAVSLVRVDVLGPVLKPGFYTAPADELVSDVVMQAGGLSPQADINKTVVRRGEVLVQPASRVQEALARGETLDQLDVRAGDAIVVGERPPNGAFLRVLEVVGAVAAIATSVVLITRH